MTNSVRHTFSTPLSGPKYKTVFSKECEVGLLNVYEISFVEL